MKTQQSPHEQREKVELDHSAGSFSLRGWLKSGNRPGDFRTAPRCGAKTRRGTRCQCPAMRNGRCRIHGGLSTGAKTKRGLARIRRANTKHGQYTNTARASRRTLRLALKALRNVYGRPKPETKVV